VSTEQHLIVSMQLNIVTCPTYPEKFIRDSVIAPSVLLSVVIVPRQMSTVDLDGTSLMG